MARRYWTAADPIGRRLRIGGRDTKWLEVVCVVGDVRARPSQEVRPTVYLPLRQSPLRGGEFALRASGGGLALLRRYEASCTESIPISPLPRLAQGMITAMIGTSVGPVIGAGASRSIAGLLLGVTPHDAATFTVVPVILLVLSCAACLLPARRSVRIEPVEALLVDSAMTARGCNVSIQRTPRDEAH